MADTLAHKAKEDGSVAWSRGDYQKAVEHFTSAINHGGDKEFLKIIYSNRSAAYLKIHKNEEALTDANKCVELDSQWAKGYTRKGDALYALKRYTECFNAYNSGLRQAPNDATLQQKCETAMRAIRNESDRAASSSSTTAPEGITRTIKLSIIILIVVYCIPFLPRSISSMSYRMAAALFIGWNLYDLYKRYGFPQFNSSYGMLIIGDPCTMKVFLGSLLALAMRPYLFAIAPLLISEGASFLPEIFAWVRDHQSMIEAKVLPMVTRFVPSMSSLPIAAIFNNNNLPTFQQQFQVVATNLEIYQGIYLIVELFLPSRNMIGLYLWWQYLRMRVMLDQSGLYKRVFSELDMKINSLLSHKMVPGIVRTGYGMIRSFLVKQAEIPAAPSADGSAGGSGSTGSSFLSQCNIM